MERTRFALAAKNVSFADWVLATDVTRAEISNKVSDRADIFLFAARNRGLDER